MAKLILNAKKLQETRSGGKAKLEALLEDNPNPIQAVEEQAKGIELLKPHTTGDPVRDMVGINHQLNNLPDHFNKCDERQLKEAWESAEKIGRASAWIKGHILLTMDKKYKDGVVRKFAEEIGLDKRTIYNYIKLAEVFPKVDPVLEPSFHFRAIMISHGDKDKAIKLIEKAKAKKKANPHYSVRNFVEEVESETKPKAKTKPINAGSLAKKIIDGLKILSKYPDLAELKNEIKEVNQLVEKINLNIKKTAGA